MALSSIEISRRNLLENIEQFRSLLPEGTKLVGVVKANAYGHGLKEIVSIAEGYVDAFQVNDIEELRVIRMMTQKPVFVFGYVLLEDLEELVDLKGVLGVYNLETLRELERIGAKRNETVVVHGKVDALIGRQGIVPSEVKVWIDALKNTPHVKLEAIYSHFSNIEDASDLHHAELQHASLMEVKKVFLDAGFEVSHHISATSGILTSKENWGGSLVRLGIGMYGLWPSKGLQTRLGEKITLKPVLSWKTHAAQMKTLPPHHPVGYGITYRTKGEETIAVIPQGYSDGYDRKLSSVGEVLIGGKRCRVLGRVAMNMFVVAAPYGAKLEDEVVLMGKQGSECITADEIAEKIGTINYEIVARLSSLLPRTVV